MTTRRAHHRRAPAHPCLWFCLLLSLLTCAPLQAGDAAPGIQVREARNWLADGVYQLSARIEYALSTPVSDALVTGVPLVIETRAQVTRDYLWVWRHPVASVTLRHELHYYALTRQYLVRNLNSGVQHSYPTEQAALDAIGTIDALPLLERRLIKKGVQYHGRVRAQLDVESLPTPLRLAAYLDTDWRLGSAWYTWPLRR